MNNVHTPISDDFMSYLEKFPQHANVMRHKGMNSYLNTSDAKELERYRHGIYTLMYCISLFLNNGELTKWKNEIRKEFALLQISIATRPYGEVEKLMGLDFIPC